MTDPLQPMIERIRAAAADGTLLRIRGGGSKDFYGQAPQGEVLDTRALAGVVSYEPTELVVTVRTGTPLAALQALLAEKGQCLAFEPPHLGAATVGGMVAAGLSGPARASAGSVRDHLLGAQLLDGRGELLNFGGTVMKNVAGYDVSRVLAGSLGVLGLITRVSLKVLPRALAEATLRFELGQADALARLNQWGGQPLPLNASCWVHDDGVGALYLRLRGATAAVGAACARLGGERVDEAQAARDWEDCREQRLPWFVARGADQALWRLSVPQTTPPLAVDEAAAGLPLIEWHGGQRWYRAAPAAGAQLREAARAAGGHATLFIAASADTTGLTGQFGTKFDALSPALMAVHRALKHEFDPAGIFNRGRLYPEL